MTDSGFLKKKKQTNKQTFLPKKLGKCAKNGQKRGFLKFTGKFSHFF